MCKQLLGLSNHPNLIAASKKMIDERGYGISSVCFIRGTQNMHKTLEAAISDYFQTKDTILYVACFDANREVFEPLFSEEDAIISDSLNHASVIDGVFSMDGNVAPIDKICDLTEKYDALIMVDESRICVQLSAGHEKEYLDQCIDAFIKVGKALGVIELQTKR